VKALADRNANWPYTEAQAAAIRDYFDPPSPRALNMAVIAASTFVDLYDPEQKKPNVRAQVERLGTAVDEMRRALSNLTSAAEDHLKRHRNISEANEPIETDKLHRLVHQFAYENRPGFEDLPEKTKAGPKEQRLEKSLIEHFKEAFIVGHDGVRPKAGFPEFRKLCRTPLVQMGLLKNLDDKSLQDKARRNN
jgi:hypothetical protein